MASAPHGSHYGSNFCCFVILVLLAVGGTIISLASAMEEFKVGGMDGWQQPDTSHTEIYGLWAAAKSFHLLHFEYMNDSVLVVDKWAYYHCNVTSPSSTDGNATISLDNIGPLYFISGDTEHCQNGQRLSVEVTPLPPGIYKSPPPSPPPRYREPDVEDSPTPSPVSTSKAATYAFSVSKTWPSSVLAATFFSFVMAFYLSLRK